MGSCERAAGIVAFIILCSAAGTVAWNSEGGTVLQDFHSTTDFDAYALLWSKIFPSTTLPVIVGSHVYIGNASGIACFNVFSGEMEWFYRTSLPVHTILYLDELYVGTLRTLYKISSAGKLVWSRSCYEDMNVYTGDAGKIVAGSAFVDYGGNIVKKFNGTVYAAAASGEHYYIVLNRTILEAYDYMGNMVWRRMFDDEIKFVSSTSAPGEKVFATLSDSIVCLDSGGNMLWQSSGRMLAHGLFYSEHVIVVADGKIVKFLNLDGETVCRRNVTAASSAAVAPKHLYVLDGFGRLTVFASGFTFYDSFLTQYSRIALDNILLLSSPSGLAAYSHKVYNLNVKVFEDSVPAAGVNVYVTDEKGVSVAGETGADGVARFQLKTHGLFKVEARESGYYTATSYVVGRPGETEQITLYLTKIVSQPYYISGETSVLYLVAIAFFAAAVFLLIFGRR
ncbi:MAG: PQQ-binding-like beta-propeller repeat protein [Nitrososphaeria archaeon]